jgi:phytoene dehydrogenase-like protein
MTTRINIIGGGIGGLTAAIAAAEQDHAVVLYEAKRELGGRAWTTTEPVRANWGPHVIYGDGTWWAWLCERGLGRPAARVPMRGRLHFRVGGRSRRMPPLETVRGLVALRRRTPPDDVSFRDWAAAEVGERPAAHLSAFMGVATFDHDPGRFSASFVHERLLRAAAPIPSARYFPGGWATLVGRLADRARELGVRIELDCRMSTLPEDGPVIVATTARAASSLLGDDRIASRGTEVALLDLELDGGSMPFIGSDMDEPGWAETYSVPDPSLAPRGHHLVQAQKGIRPGESLDDAVCRIEAMLDDTYPGWREREVWRRRARLESETGALDVPGSTWRDRPAVDRGGDVYLVNDMVAAPGLLAEVSVNAALEAVALAGREARPLRPGAREQGAGLGGAVG